MDNRSLAGHKFHRFLDEAGDTTFYGKRKIPIIGSKGVSNYFIIGMLKIHEPLNIVRLKIVELQNLISSDPYFSEVVSINKKKISTGYRLHATDDIPEVRKLAFELIKSLNCSFEAVVGRKDYSIYERKHNGNQAEFYADMLSHLLHENLHETDELVLNIAKRSSCTNHLNLEKGIQKAQQISKKKFGNSISSCRVVFNVQKPSTEPIINVTDYFLWALQRKLERSEIRFYKFIEAQIESIKYLYAES